MVFRNAIILNLLTLLLLQGCSFEDNREGWLPAPCPIRTRWSEDITPSNVWQEYPRPQMVRETWLNLNGLWEYAIRPKEEGMPDTMDGKILVPFPVESSLSGVGRRVGEENKVWYRRKVKIPLDWEGKRMILKFEASDWETRIWLDSQYLVVWRGGYDTFGVDITKRVEAGGEYELTVSVSDPTDSGDQPRGKQANNPEGIFYTPTTGIWQTVWVEALPHTAIGRFVSIPDIDKEQLTIIPFVMGDKPDDQVRIIAKADGKEIARATGEHGDSLILPIKSPNLWSPENPYLYDLELQVLRDERVIDKVESYFGMRKVSIGKDDKGITRILLNNKFVFQNGVLDQGFWPDGIYLPPSDEAMRADIEMTKAMGFNMLRKHVKIESNRFYFWCDKVGIWVWQDMPNSDKAIGPEDPDLKPNIASDFQFQLELKKMIFARINHPSIIMWVPFNEGWGQYNTEGVVGAIKEWDPTRLVNAASGWADRGVGDVQDIHNYPGPKAPPLEEDRAIVLGEFGGLNLIVKNHLWQEKNRSYEQMNDKESLLVKYEEYYQTIQRLARDSGLSASVYTQLTDVESETNGLMTYDREVVKIAVEKLREIHLREEISR